MRTEIRKAVLPRELRSLVALDRKIFPVSDRFRPSDWMRYESYWLLLDGRKIGCCAFQKHATFELDDQVDPRLQGSLYVATTGIVPCFQGMGFGDLLKSWQVAYARHHGFTRIVTNTRKRNQAMISLNRKHGFKVIETALRYYTDPADSAVVMELLLPAKKPPRPRSRWFQLE